MPSHRLRNVCYATTAAMAAMLLLSACGGQSSRTDPDTDPDAAVQLSPAQFSDAMAEPGTFVLNVHTPDEGSIRGTDAKIPFDQLDARADELPADKSTPIAVYCLTGRMSALAAVTLSDLGYTDVTELKGGMEAWQENGRDLLKPGQAAAAPE